jgi:hypothetical protein
MVLLTGLACFFIQLVASDESNNNLATFILNRSKTKHNSHSAKHSSYSDYEALKKTDKPRSNTTDGQVESSKPSLSRKASLLKFLGKSKSCENVLMHVKKQKQLTTPPSPKTEAAAKKARAEKLWTEEIIRAFDDLSSDSSMIGMINMLADQARDSNSENILGALVKYNNNLSQKDLGQLCTYITGFNQMNQLPNAVTQKSFNLSKEEEAFHAGHAALKSIQHPVLKYYADFYSNEFKNHIFKLSKPPFGLSSEFKAEFNNFKKFQKMHTLTNDLRQLSIDQLRHMDSEAIRTLIENAENYGKSKPKA